MNPPEKNIACGVDWGKPPNKVYVNFFNDTGNPMFDGFACSWQPDAEALKTFEYHLSQWHDAKEPPKEDVEVLVWDNHYIYIGKVIKDKFCVFGEDGWSVETKPIFWMPLPEPPKESER